MLSQLSKANITNITTTNENSYGLYCVLQLMTSKIYSCYTNPICVAWISFFCKNHSYPNLNEFIALSFQVMILPMLVTFLKPVETTYRKSVGTFHSEIGGNTSSTVHISQMSIPIIQNVSNCSKVRLALRMFSILKFWSI